MNYYRFNIKILNWNKIYNWFNLANNHFLRKYKNFKMNYLNYKLRILPKKMILKLLKSAITN